MLIITNSIVILLLQSERNQKGADGLSTSLTWRLDYRVIQKHICHAFARSTERGLIGTVELGASVQTESVRCDPVHEVFKYDCIANIINL